MRGTQTLRIGGRSLRGRSYRFAHPQVRPTRQIVREAVLNILRARVLVDPSDLVLVPFAGSGLLGFDIHSEFGCNILFNDVDRKVCTQLQQTIEALHLTDACRLQAGNIRQWVQRLPVAAGLVLDPPYQAGWLEDSAWLQSMAAASQLQWVLVESESTAADLALPGFTQCVRREYGSTAIQLLVQSDAI